MTARVSRLAQGVVDPASVAGLVDLSLQPGRAIALTFADGVVHIMLDQSGDWTITTGLSVSSDRFLSLTRTLEELGFFSAAEESGMVYHLWTSALDEDRDDRGSAERVLLKVLKCFETHYAPSYIG